ncbi:hypothetical protein MTO96_050696 [Rhipicephalus appendiculatus]
MSKLRAAGAGDAAAANALRKARRSKSSHSAVKKSEHRDDSSVLSTKTAENHSSKPVGAKHSDAVTVKDHRAIATTAVNDNATTEDGLNNLASVSVLVSRREPLHSISERHNRVARKKAYRRKRGKKESCNGCLLRETFDHARLFASCTHQPRTPCHKR